MDCIIYNKLNDPTEQKLWILYNSFTPQDLKKNIERQKKLRSKIINLNWLVTFNDTCLKENLWPKYTKDNFFNRPEHLTIPCFTKLSQGVAR